MIRSLLSLLALFVTAPLLAAVTSTLFVSENGRNDPATVNGVAQSYTLEVSGQSSLRFGLHTSNLPTRRVEPGQLIRYNASISGGGATAQNVVVTLTLPNGGTFEEISGLTDCTIEASRATCRRPQVAASEIVTFSVAARAPSRLEGGEVVLQAAVTADGTEFDPSDNVASVTNVLPRQLVVTNTNDAGAGSLRQALLEAQTLCATALCRVVFNIPPPVPAEGWFTIRPLSQLPEVRGWVKIDGATQRAFTGDTSPRPEIAIVGDQAGDANGILAGEGCEIQLLDLAISGFARSGIEVLRRRFDPSCDRSLIEAFPNLLIARNRIESNHRGVMLSDVEYATVNDNFIAANRRSGIYGALGFFAEIRGNQIVSNGGSGLFLDIGTRVPYPGGADVYDNAILENGEWGIARTDRGEMSMRRNAIAGNRYQGIDLNLDFETPNRPVDDTTSVPNKPVLFSAQFDAERGVTIVRGRLDSLNPVGSHTFVDFYASTHLSDTGQASAEYWIGDQQYPGGNVAADFDVEFPGDLRGKSITATTTRRRIVGLLRPPDVSTDSHLVAVPSDTSELSNVVVVQ